MPTPLAKGSVAQSQGLDEYAQSGGPVEGENGDNGRGDGYMCSDQPWSSRQVETKKRNWRDPVLHRLLTAYYFVSG